MNDKSLCETTKGDFGLNKSIFEKELLNIDTYFSSLVSKIDFFVQDDNSEKSPKSPEDSDEKEYYSNDFCRELYENVYRKLEIYINYFSDINSKICLCVATDDSEDKGAEFGHSNLSEEADKKEMRRIFHDIDVKISHLDFLLDKFSKLISFITIDKSTDDSGDSGDKPDDPTPISRFKVTIFDFKDRLYKIGEKIEYIYDSIDIYID